MPDLEQALTEYVRTREPADLPPFAAVAARARSRRRRRRVGAVVLAVTSLAAVLVAFWPDLPQDGSTVPGVVASSGPSGSPTRTGAVPFTGTFACVDSYSTEGPSHAEFAFDGTVTDVAPPAAAHENQVNKDLRTVTFEVNEWIRGGPDRVTTVVMFAPAGQDPPSYDVGTRLLVSGAQDGEVRQAWGCGFTRYYDEATTSSWRDLTR